MLFIDQFQRLPDTFQSLKNSVNQDTLKTIYNNFDFLYFNYNNQTIKEDGPPFTIQLLFFLKNFKFVTCYNISHFQIICVENICLIIESIQNDAICKIIKENLSFSINLNEESDKMISVLAEVNNFCYYFQDTINNNKFLQLTINPISCFIIRRNYYPSYFFKKKNFFSFDQYSPLNEDEINKQLLDLINKNQTIDESNIYQIFKSIQETVLAVDQNLLLLENQKMYNFSEDEFVFLRNIQNPYSIYIHTKSLNIFIIKKINEDFDLKSKREIYFCEHFSHRCFRRCFGLIKNGEIVDKIVYEFMSNDTLYENIDRLNEISSFTIIIRFFQCLHYLQNNSLVHRDLKPDNILVDHNFNYFISDFETIRQLGERIDFSYDFGSDDFSAPEHIEGKHVSFPIDVYSFGKIVDLIFQNFNDGFSPKISELISICTKKDPNERATLNQIKSIIYDLLQYLCLPNQCFSSMKLHEIIQFIFESLVFMKFYYKTENIKEFLTDIILSILLTKSQNTINIGNLNFNLAMTYYKEKNYKIAKKYFKIAAYFNNSSANFNLGTIYLFGLGEEIDYQKALEYYGLSAEQDHPMAYNQLGVIYFKGYGVKIDYKKAKYYFELSAKHNIPQGNLHLGIIYLLGLGEVHDFLKAKYYFELGAKENESMSILYLAQIYFLGCGVKRDVNKMIYYYKKASKLNNSVAQYFLGINYYFGEFIPKNFVKAKKYFELASFNQNSLGLFSLGFLYYEGKGVEQNYYKAKEYFTFSSEKNNPDALFFLGHFYENGFGCDINLNKAIEYYLKCIDVTEDSVKIPFEINNLLIDLSYSNTKKFRAYNDMGLINLFEFDLIEKAIELIRKSANEEYPLVQNNYGLLSEFYIGKENPEYWYNKAIKNKCILSFYNLGHYKDINENTDSSLKLYVEASNLNNIRFEYSNEIIVDERFEISTIFIICITNLKLTAYYIEKENFQKAKEYLLKAIFLPLFQLLFQHHNQSFIYKSKQKTKFNLSDFVLNFPLFELQYQINNDRIKFPNSNWTKIKPNSKNKIISIQIDENNDSSENIIDMKNDFFPEPKKSIDDVNNVDDYINFIDKMFHNTNVDDAFQKIDQQNRLQQEDYVEMHFINNNFTNDFERIIKYPKKMFSYLFHNINELGEQVKNILQDINSFLYDPPHPILFGRIKINNNSPKPKTKRDINQLFYDGFN